MRIAENVLTVLDRLTYDATGPAPVVRIEGQLDRKLYVEVNKVLEALGGAWDRYKKGHVFPCDPQQDIEAVMVAGKITTTRELGYFPTPPEIVARLVAAAEVEPGMSVLEPSAGRGAIIAGLPRPVGFVHAFEIDRRQETALRASLATTITFADFLDVEPHVQVGFDRVVMNPPFGLQQDIDHVRHAFRFLKPGGRLASVMSGGVAFRENRKTVEFRNWVTGNDGRIERLPDDAFVVSATHVRTVLVTVRRSA
jgi:predicted RNA methylase